MMKRSLPKHIGFIPDGNRRWAVGQGRPKQSGYEAGIEPGSIDDVRGCTVCDKERFHSFRRDRDRSGRLLSAVVARGARS